MQSGEWEVSSWIDETLSSWGIGRRKYTPPVPVPANPLPAEQSSYNWLMIGAGAFVLYLIYKEFK